MSDYVDRRVTSPTWALPPPYKQALKIKRSLELGKKTRQLCWLKFLFLEGEREIFYDDLKPVPVKTDIFGRAKKV